MTQLLISYVDLSPGIENTYINDSHKLIIEKLREAFMNWTLFHEKYPDYNLGFTIVTKKGVLLPEVKGPTIVKRLKCVDYTLFLPETIDSLVNYINIVFDSISEIMENYNVSKNDIDKLKSNVINNVLF